jgi:hypothetical protein
MSQGICTIANDVVYDQLVAWLNSIEANAGRDIPVCVIAYDDRLEQVRTEIEKRPQVTLLNDPDLFQRWEDFSYRVWETHPTALQTWQERGVKTRFYRVGENHRYCAFDPDALFEKFIYMDADTLLMGPVDFIFAKLDEVDFAVYDFQYKDPGHIYNVNSPRLFQVFPESRIKTEIFCSGFYGANRGLLTEEQREWAIAQLRDGDAEILYPEAPNQSVLNYMIMKNKLSVYNFGLHLPPEKRTGNSVTSPHFENRNYVLYDKGNRLTYLHYIGLSAKLFKRLCAGENIGFPYRDIFLHYRYLHEPEKRPQFTGKPKAYNAPPGLWQRLSKKLGLSAK